MRDLIASRAARLIEKGWVVNLGIGIPVACSKYLDADAVYLQTENGLVGVGPPPPADQVDKNLIDASKLPVTARAGASFFDSAESFAMIRGGHVHASILGALQVDERGVIANWAAPGQPVLGVGGAMDILAGIPTIIVAMTHTNKDGSPKIVERCTMPITALRPVSWVVTELATFRFDRQLILVELAPSVSVEDVRARTAARFEVRV